ncbi:unnamed protein product [Strongylus vulgaris]|uniref:Uncharacterized protein n=1 Tax=Strongylus vulgaris TaxID=40348 RepID=A0A3P7K9T6_STRVU|nr:unnamed protein product [Strongylus vulgaris]
MKRRRRITRRLVRILCGRRLPQTWNTVLVLLSIHMYLTVPVMLAAGITEHMTGRTSLCHFGILLFKQAFFVENSAQKISLSNH